MIIKVATKTDVSDAKRAVMPPLGTYVAVIKSNPDAVTLYTTKNGKYLLRYTPEIVLIKAIGDIEFDNFPYVLYYNDIPVGWTDKTGSIIIAEDDKPPLWYPFRNFLYATGEKVVKEIDPQSYNGRVCLVTLEEKRYVKADGEERISRRVQEFKPLPHDLRKDYHPVPDTNIVFASRELYDAYHLLKAPKKTNDIVF